MTTRTRRAASARCRRRRRDRLRVEPPAPAAGAALPDATSAEEEVPTESRPEAASTRTCASKGAAEGRTAYPKRHSVGERWFGSAALTGSAGDRSGDSGPDSSLAGAAELSNDLRAVEYPTRRERPDRFSSTVHRRRRAPTLFSHSLGCPRVAPVGGSFYGSSTAIPVRFVAYFVTVRQLLAERRRAVSRTLRRPRPRARSARSCHGTSPRTPPETRESPERRRRVPGPG